MKFVSKISLSLGALLIAACGGSSTTATTTPVGAPMPSGGSAVMRNAAITAPSPDPRVGLKPGLQDAGEAIWNLKKVGHAPSPTGFDNTNSDLAFHGTHVIQGNYNGFQIWDIADPAAPHLVLGKLCPASQSDVSVYQNLLFVSAEAPTARLDCGAQAPRETVSKDRIRGVRIFDISDINNPKYVTNVQTCRGSHTHTVVNDPRDPANVYIYISGTSGVRPEAELAGCAPDPRDVNTALFNIEIIKVPLANPKLAAIVSHARIFQTGEGTELVNTLGSHGASPADANGAGGRGRGGRFGLFGAGMPTTFVRAAPGGMSGAIAEIAGLNATSSATDTAAYMRESSSLKSQGYVGVTGGGRGGFGGGRGGRGAAPVAAPVPATHEDSLRVWSQYALMQVAPLTATSTKPDSTRWLKSTDSLRAMGYANIPFPAQPRGTLTQCHDITVYPAMGLAGGACAGMGLLLDIHDTPNPRRIDAYADTNFSFWHSATFSNDGSMVLFSDEWGGGGAAYCRAGDPKNWGGDALFKIINGKLTFQSYYKMPAAQTAQENCVAHNGSLIPIPGRTVMVQAWYQGGLSVFEWTDPAHPKEIGFFDRGPNDGTNLVGGGFWSAYWYNGHIIGSEMKRGLDIFELAPSAAISQNEIDAAKSVTLQWENVQDQPKFVWPPSFALARSYADQLERDNGLSAGNLSAVRSGLSTAEGVQGAARRTELNRVAGQISAFAAGSSDKGRVEWLATAVKDLAAATP
jgi:hypothetical protein